jgi:hypothetical protein
VTYDERGEERQIKRWDPRSGLKYVTNAVTLDMAYAGAFGEYMEFTETMRQDVFGTLHYRFNSGSHGWDAKDELWKWSDK